MLSIQTFESQKVKVLQHRRTAVSKNHNRRPALHTSCAQQTIGPKRAKILMAGFAIIYSAVIQGEGTKIQECRGCTVHPILGCWRCNHSEPIGSKVRPYHAIMCCSRIADDGRRTLLTWLAHARISPIHTIATDRLRGLQLACGWHAGRLPPHY